jgi:hypothetical protein
MNLIDNGWIVTEARELDDKVNYAVIRAIFLGDKDLG